MIRAAVPTPGTAEALDPFDPRGWCAAEPEPYYIQLSDRFDIYAIVDPEDHAWARQHRWYHTYGSGRFVWIGGVKVIERPDSIYAIRSVGDAKIYLHREILTRWKGSPPSARHVGDHLNGNTLLCRRSNLRWATKSQNARNVVGSRTRARFLQAMGA